MKSIIVELQWLGKGYFWPIWVLITVTLSAATAIILSTSKLPAPRPPADGAANFFEASVSSKALMIFIMLAFIALYVAVTLVWEDFNYYDNSMFDLYTLQGHNYPPPITPSTGRFFPLSHQEFNLIRLFTSSVVGYHIFSIIELILLCLLLLFIDMELPISVRATLAIIALLSSGVLTSFVQLIFAERNMVLVFLGIALSITLFERTGSTMWACITIVFVQLMLYYKEMSLVMILCWGVGRVVLRLWIAKNEERSLIGVLRDKRNLLDLCIIMSGILYLIYYVIMEIGVSGVSYAAARKNQYLDVALAYISTDFFAVALILAVLGRGWLVIYRRATPWVLWDSAGVGAVASIAGYIYLALYSWYYLTVVDVVAVLYVGRVIVLSWKNVGSWIKVGAVSLLALIAVHDIAFSLYSLYEEKNIVHIKTKIAEIIAQRYRNDHGPRRIFFPFSNPYVISEFAAYLNYRDMPVERVDEDNIEGKGEVDKLIMVTPRTSSANEPARSININPDGRCVPWLPFRCRSEAQAASGDMVVILPDDQVSAKRVGEEEPLPNQFVFEPWPRLSDGIIRMFLGPEAAIRFEQGRIPDHWLTGLVTEL